MARKVLPLIRITTAKDSRVHLVDRDRFVIGRSAEADILLTGNSISRKHLSVDVRNDEIVIEDHGSSNGSFIADVQMEPNKKYPIKPRTPIRLGLSTEIVTIELMDRPVEFDQYKDYLHRFNADLQVSFEKSMNDAQGKSAQVLKEAQRQAEEYASKAKAQTDEFLQKARAQEKAILESAQTRSETILRGAEKAVQDMVDKVKKEGEAQNEALLEKTKKEVLEFRSSKLEQVKKEAEALQAQAIDQARTLAHRELQEKREQAGLQVREHLTQIKVQAQMEADQILQNAHKEATVVRESATQEFEKFRLDAQKRAANIVSEAEVEAERLMTQAREASEKMRQSARQDADEARQRSQQLCHELMETTERETKLLLENAKKKATTIVENQERESSAILKDLKNRIETEAHREAQKYIQDSQDQIQRSKQAAQEEVQAAQNSKSRIEETIASLNRELETLQKQKSHMSEENQTVSAQLARLKEETSRQNSLNEKLAALEENLKALELQRSQLASKNEQTQAELDLIKKNTFEDLERVRKEEEKKVLQMAAIKAKEFSRHIEKVLVQEINAMLPTKLEADQLAAVTGKMSEEMVQLFAAESIKHNEKASLHEADATAAPSIFKNIYFRIAAIAAVAGIGFYLVKNSDQAVQMQEQFTEALIEKQREEVEFKPQMSVDYRNSYTDNVLYLDRYVELKTNSEIQDQWALNLNEFFLKDLKLSEENMVRFIGIESALVKRLVALRASVDSRFLEEGIKRMRDTEREETTKIMALLQTQDNWNRLRTREKLFLAQAWTTPIRNPADEAVSPPQEYSTGAGTSVPLGAPAVPEAKPAKRSKRH